jgi:hypothetical protein
MLILYIIGLFLMVSQVLIFFALAAAEADLAVPAEMTTGQAPAGPAEDCRTLIELV